MGTVIGSSRRGVSCICRLSVFKKRQKPSVKQLEQQMRFGLMTRLLSPVKPLLEIGFKNYDKRQTAYNGALSSKLKMRLVGV